MARRDKQCFCNRQPCICGPDEEDTSDDWGQPEGCMDCRDLRKDIEDLEVARDMLEDKVKRLEEMVDMVVVTSKNRLAKIRELEMALVNYGRHSDTCRRAEDGNMGECDCGYSELCKTFRD